MPNNDYSEEDFHDYMHHQVAEVKKLSDVDISSDDVEMLCGTQATRKSVGRATTSAMKLKRGIDRVFKDFVYHELREQYPRQHARLAARVCEYRRRREREAKKAPKKD